MPFMAGSLLWLLQWPIRAAILLLISRLPLGVDMANFKVALLSAGVIGLLGTLLLQPLRFVLAPLRLITTLGGLIPVGFLFDWLVSIVLFGLTAWLIQGFRLRNGFTSAVFGALVYSFISFFVLRALGLEVPLTRAMALLFTNGPLA
jgi:putative membrane protein